MIGLVFRRQGFFCQALRSNGRFFQLLGDRVGAGRFIRSSSSFFRQLLGTLGGHFDRDLFGMAQRGQALRLVGDRVMLARRILEEAAFKKIHQEAVHGNNGTSHREILSKKGGIGGGVQFVHPAQDT